jgi:hypothetical protein
MNAIKIGSFCEDVSLIALKQCNLGGASHL